MAARDRVPADPQQEHDFDKAFGLLEQLVDLTQADQICPLRANAVYLSSVVLWMLVYQRMNPDSSLEAAVKMLLASRPRLLPDNRASRTKRSRPTPAPTAGREAGCRWRPPTGWPHRSASR